MKIRPMEDTDADEVASLCAQWGYAVEVGTLRQRFLRISESSGQAVMVAVCDDAICGWVHVIRVDSLGSHPYAEVKGIIVDENHRRQGIGKELMTSVDDWAIRSGCLLIRLRSGTERTEAHRFYPGIGFQLTKTQHVYEKRVNQNTNAELRY